MEFTLRDVIYISANVLSVGIVFAMFRGEVKSLKEDVQTIKNVLFQAKGGLNIVDTKTCEKQQRTIGKQLEEEASKNDIMVQNIIRIMMHMNVTPVLPKNTNGFHVEPLDK